MDEVIIHEMCKKISQAITIHAILIQRNNCSFALIKKKKTKKAGFDLLKKNYESEKNVFSLFHKRAVNTIKIIDDLIKKNETTITDKQLSLLKQITETMSFFKNKSAKTTEKRLYYESKYLNVRSFLLRKTWILLLKITWRKELLLNTKIQQILNKGEIKKHLHFWNLIGQRKCPSASKIKKLNTAFESLPKGTLIKEAINTFLVKGTFWAAVVANPLTAAYLILTKSTSLVEQAAISALIWKVSGLTTRCIVLLIETKNVYDLALLNYHTQLISGINLRKD